MSSVSVIIPFYKDYAYLKQAVESVLTENLSDCEIIIVNDNPCARSEAFLDRCQFSGPVRIVTHAHNRGLSAARNTGLDAASGDYIAYLDADDFFLPRGLSWQLDWAAKTGADICHGVTVLREQRGFIRPAHSVLARDKRFFEITRADVRISGMPELQFIVSSWQSVYRRDFLERTGIRFDEAQKKFEDRLYVLETVFSGAHFALTDTPVRAWRRRRDSITTSSKSIEDVSMMTALIDKCTGLAEAAVADGRIRQINLQREVVHSLARLLYELPVLDVALGDDAAAPAIQETLTRALSRATPQSDIFSDNLVKAIVVDGRRNRDGHAISLKHVERIWSAIAASDWDRVATLQADVSRGNGRGQGAAAPKEPSPAAPAVVRAAPRFEDRELILHLGLHKTGTTHLQRQLSLNVDKLKAAGILFPQTGFVDHADIAVKPNATPGHQKFVRAIAYRDEHFFETFEREVAASDCRHILLSCENLSFPYMPSDRREARISDADALFRNFPNRRIVATIRRPDQYFESMYRERVSNVENGEARSALEFLNEHRSMLLDFAGMLGPWREFASGRMDLIDYSELRDGSDYQATFLSKIGFEPIRSPAPGDVGQNQTYESPHWDEIEILRIISSTIKDSWVRKDVSMNVLNSMRYSRGDEPDRSVLDVDDRLEIVRDNRAYSQAFFESVGFRFDYDALEADIEGSRDTAGMSGGIDPRLVEVLLNQLHTYDAVLGTPPAEEWARARVVQTIQARAEGTTTAAARLEKVRSTLMPIYRNLPAPVRSVARSGYRWLAGHYRSRDDSPGRKARA